MQSSDVKPHGGDSVSTLADFNTLGEKFIVLVVIPIKVIRYTLCGMIRSGVTEQTFVTNS